MKVAIYTIPPHDNYGGILQAFALQTVLERMGHQVEILDMPTRWKVWRWKTPLIWGKRLFKKILGQKSELFFEQRMNREYPIVTQNTMRFVRQYLHCRTVNDLKEIKRIDYDAYVVGSDQIWRPIYTKNICHSFFDFAEQWNVKRIAYAVSFGTDQWEYTPEQEKVCKRLAALFDAVSVREDSAVKLVQKHFGLPAQHVLDPTMLLNADDYLNLVHATETQKASGNLLCYVLDETPEKTATIEKIAQTKKLTPFRANSRNENPNAPLAERIQPSVEQWLRDFSEAEFVFTDSFHACVFSIIFNKPFLVYGNEKRGVSRIQSLLSMFGLEKRLIQSQDNLKDLININNEVALQKLEDLKIIAFDFLNKNL